MTGVALKNKCGALDKLDHQDKAEVFARVQVQERGKKMSEAFAQSLQTNVHRKPYCVC